jgi:FkbM family methyltransferase
MPTILFNKKRLEKNKILKFNLKYSKPEELIIKNKLLDLHKNLKLDFGNFSEEFPEQMMVIRYLKGDEKVLEIGGNIGRNSLIIASILNNNNNFVSLECDYNIFNQLKHNKEKNNLNFYIENSALSKRKLIQKGWDTIPSEEVLADYKPVNIISWEELNNKYNINFDTLVLDCEGAFYYILMDMPEILNNIKLIVMENDYWDITKYNYVNNKLKENNFILDYFEKGGWGPCENNFFEVWKKI